MGGVSIWQLLIIAVIIVLLLGTRKPNSIGPDPGVSIKGFKGVIGDDELEQDKTDQDADSTVKTTADKQADTNQEQVRTGDTKRYDKKQVQPVPDIGFNELLLVFVIDLIVLRPQRLPVTVETVTGRICVLCLLAITAQSELTQELEPQEFQDSLKKVGRTSFTNLTLELKALMDELRQAAELTKRSYVASDPEEASDEVHAIYNPVVKDNKTMHEGVVSAVAQTQASLPGQEPEVTLGSVVKPAADAESKVAVPSPSSSDKL